MDQIVVAGENIAVEVVVGADLYEHVSQELVAQWLQDVGFSDDQYRNETVQVFAENGFDMPMAWTAPVRSELAEINVNVGAGPVYCWRDRKVPAGDGEAVWCGVCQGAAGQRAYRC